MAVTKSQGRTEPSTTRHRLSTTPEFEECGGGYVFRVVDVGGDPKSVAIDAVVVEIEDSDESIGVTCERCVPGHGFVPR